MVSINDKKYNSVEHKITYGEYNVSQCGKRRSGIAPFISFKCNNIYIGIEMTYDLQWIKEIKYDTAIDIAKYISDITYEDEKGWLSLIFGEYTCLISKKSNNVVNFVLNYEGREGDTDFKIYIKEDITFKY